jgi:hypothetical protein
MITDLNPTEIEKRELKEAIAWLRPDPRKRLYPAWALGVLLVISGSGCCGIFFHQAIPDSVMLLLIGLGAILLGMLTMVISAIKVLSDDTSILWTETALIYRDQDARRTELTWNEILSIHCEPSLEYIELRSATGEFKLHLQFMQLDPETLCDVLKAEQRKSLMGIKLSTAVELRALNIPVSLPRNQFKK